jgi:hypothetical protein
MPLTQREIDAAEAHAKTPEGYVPQGHNPVTVCDHCKTESELYVWFPSCADCGEQVCKACRLTDYDDETNSTVCLTCGLLRAIEVAADPESKAPQYRPARREAVRLARLLVRNFIASEWRENLKASAALTAPDTRIRHDGASWVDLDQKTNFAGE